MFYYFVFSLQRAPHLPIPDALTEHTNWCYFSDCHMRTRLALRNQISRLKYNAPWLCIVCSLHKVRWLHFPVNIRRGDTCSCADSAIDNAARGKRVKLAAVAYWRVLATYFCFYKLSTAHAALHIPSCPTASPTEARTALPSQWLLPVSPTPAHTSPLRSG